MTPVAAPIVAQPVEPWVVKEPSVLGACAGSKPPLLELDPLELLVALLAAFEVEPLAPLEDDDAPPDPPPLALLDPVVALEEWLVPAPDPVAVVAACVPHAVNAPRIQKARRMAR
jgi:hypothetical protein